MRFDTRVTRLFGIEVPIIQGPMAWLSEARLVAAVSNEGGLGVLGASLMSVAEFEQQVEAAAALTQKPFAVNFPLVLADYTEHLEMVLRHGVRIVFTSAGSPRKFTARIKEAGALCVHVVPSLKHALTAIEAGVDAVVLESVEAGGHVSAEGITGFTNIPNVRRHVEVPLIAAGGIVDGRGMAAAMCLGADGIQMGTRFLATQECNGHPTYKELLLKAGELDTPLHSRQWHPGRALRSPVVDQVLQMERDGRTIEEVRAVIGRGRARKAAHDGNLAEGMFFAGAGAALIRDVPTVKDLFARILREYDECLQEARARAGLA
ncbi:MAG: nitronate monooxygenase [Myxococcota bacterium]